ncbi:MAG TPA: transporter substrate-binding domain-containing protein [Marinobacter sp.]|nr:transporter substrate-binding domain-containing protein [Marinobacter sp.]
MIKVGSIIAVLLVALGGCRYPADVEDSLESVKSGHLHIGAIHNPPWVDCTEGNGPARGLEAELAEGLAARLDATIHWSCGPESQIIKALEQNQLQLAIGGLVHSPRTAEGIALSNPYYTSQKQIGFRSEADIPAEADTLSVGILRLDPLSLPLRELGADVRFVDDYQTANLPLAASDWQLEALGLTPGPWVLASEQHVWAAPPGENGWMMEIQTYLNSHKKGALRARLVELGREARQ